MNILLLNKYSRNGASSRLRMLQFLPYLSSQGMSITTSALLDEKYLVDLYRGGRRSRFRIVFLYWQRFKALLSLRQYDLIWIEKEVFPYLPSLAEKIISLTGKPYVVDYDDAVFHNYDMSSSFLMRMFLGRKIDSVMRYSSCVIAGNDYLAQRAKIAKALRTVVIPTVVDQSRYHPVSHAERTTLTIGWIGSPSTQKYLIEISEVLAKVCSRFNARLLLVGASSDIYKHFSECNVDVAIWTEDTEATLVSQMQIGIMPIPNGPWEKGKCGYKLIQYMASSVPVVASPVGVNVEIVNDNQCGYLARTHEDWYNRLSALCDSYLLRQRFGEAGLQAVRKKYSIQSQCGLLRDIFLELKAQKHDNDR